MLPQCTWCRKWGHGIDLKHMFQLGKGDGSGRFFHIVAALPVPDMARQQASGKSIDQFGNVSAGLVAVRTFGIHGLCGNFRRLGGRQWLDILVRQEQGGDSRRHDDRAAQNGSCLDEGTCFLMRFSMTWNCPDGKRGRIKNQDLF